MLILSGHRHAVFPPPDVGFVPALSLDRFNVDNSCLSPDQNGLTDAGELKTLTEIGITSILLNRTTMTGTNQDHDRGFQGGFIRANGTTGTVATIYFQTDQRDTRVGLAQHASTLWRICVTSNLGQCAELGSVYSSTCSSPGLPNITIRQTAGPDKRYVNAARRNECMYMGTDVNIFEVNIRIYIFYSDR